MTSNWLMKVERTLQSQRRQASSSVGAMGKTRCGNLISSSWNGRTDLSTWLTEQNEKVMRQPEAPDCSAGPLSLRNVSAHLASRKNVKVTFECNGRRTHTARKNSVTSWRNTTQSRLPETPSPSRSLLTSCSKCVKGRCVSVFVFCSGKLRASYVGRVGT